MRVAPCLMFKGKAEEAMTLYASLLPDSGIEAIERYGAEGPGSEGSVMQARMRIAGQMVMCMDSAVTHAFDFTPSFSLFADCDDEASFERLTSTLAEGGGFLMAPDAYGFSRRFAWLTDRYGVSWQINLP